LTTSPREAATKGHTILDPNALAIETKSSWIEPTAVSGPSDYVQVSAVVPTFDKTDPNNWVPNGQAWGSNDGGNPANAAALNTQIISANASVISQCGARLFRSGVLEHELGQRSAAGQAERILPNAVSLED
jgi:hypothetical protein